jgi:hypothetical protein
MITVTRGHDWMACQPSVPAFSSCFHDTCYPPLFAHPRGLGCFLVPDCPRAYILTDHAAATRVVNVTNVLTGSSRNLSCIAQVLALRAMVDIYGVDKLRSAWLSPNYDNYQVKNLRGQVVVVMHTSLAGRDDTLSELPVPYANNVISPAVRIPSPSTHRAFILHEIFGVWNFNRRGKMFN